MMLTRKVNKITILNYKNPITNLPMKTEIRAICDTIAIAYITSIKIIFTGTYLHRLYF